MCAFGVRSISLQGGGIINGTFLAAGLVDELSLVIYPGIDGLSGVPSIFEYLGKPGMKPAAGQTLELKSAERLEKGVVWLRSLRRENPAFAYRRGLDFLCLIR